MAFVRDLRSGRSYHLTLIWRQLHFLSSGYTPCTYLSPARVLPRRPVMRASPTRWRQRPRVSSFQFLTQGLLDFSSTTGCDQELLGNSFWYPEPHHESPPATWKHSDYSLLVAGEAVIAHRIVPPWTPPPFSPPSPAKALTHTVTPAAGKLLARLAARVVWKTRRRSWRRPVCTEL